MKEETCGTLEEVVVGSGAWVVVVEVGSAEVEVVDGSGASEEVGEGTVVVSCGATELEVAEEVSGAAEELLAVEELLLLELESTDWALDPAF